MTAMPLNNTHFFSSFVGYFSKSCYNVRELRKGVSGARQGPPQPARAQGAQEELYHSEEPGIVLCDTCAILWPQPNAGALEQVEHTRTERSVLGYVHHPFIVGLTMAFQVPAYCFLLLVSVLFVCLCRLQTNCSSCWTTARAGSSSSIWARWGAFLRIGRASMPRRSPWHSSTCTV